MDIEKRNRLISVVLFIVIVALGYVLYDSITTPYKEEMARKAMIERVRLRMSNVRDGLVYYRNKNDKFPKEIDSLITFLKRDSISVSMGDSLYGSSFKKGKFTFDSLLFSPRTGNKFSYALNDTIRPNIYLLKDPDSDDHIGSLTKTTSLNAPSW
ncbi:hypothetical protein EP331_03995 [bacterium]|nr:MAG: hypothetical protein EP331_03995 [bacterium]